LEDVAESERENLFHQIGLAGLKYFILKVDPKKRMMFNPEDSIDFNGNTGPFIQYTHARIRSIIRKADDLKYDTNIELAEDFEFEPKEVSILKLLHDYSEITLQAAQNMSPALIANFVYELAKEYNQFYHEISILKEEDEAKRSFRIGLSNFVGNTIKSSMALLGIQVPERM